MASHIVSPRQSIPLFLTVSQASVGGVAGLSPTVRLRRTSDQQFLDWNDNTFKAAGHTTLDGALTDLGGGHYQRIVDLGVIGAVALDVLVATFSVDDGADIVGVSNDIYNVEDLELMRQTIENRMEETPGNPGQLTLFDDDGVTPRRRWEIRDASGSTVVSTAGTPARRSAPI